MSRETRVANLSLEILNVIRESEHASFLAPDELKESIIRVRSVVDFLCSPLSVGTTTPQTTDAPPAQPVEQTPSEKAPPAPTEKKPRAAAKKEAVPPTPTPGQVEFYDGTNREHKKVLVGILKGDHGFDLNDSNFAAMAGEVNGELTKALVNFNNEDAMKETVAKLVDEAMKRRNGAPF